MTTVQPKRQFSPENQFWILFGAAAILFYALCIWGGFSGSIGENSFHLPRSILGDDPLIIPSGKFIILFSLTWIVGLTLLLLFPRKLPTRKSGLVIIGLALMFRLPLLAQEPSDDINRYLWEARILHQGISPYHFAPDDPILSGLAKNDPFHARINHPDLPAVYPPFILYIFSLLTLISYGPLIIKTVMLLFDLGTIGLLLLLLDHRHLDRRWSILYAFNPVILYAFAGQGHFDVIQNFFLMGAICFYDRRLWGWMFLFVGLAVQSKYVAAVTVPFFITRFNYKYVWITAASVILFYLPFVHTQWHQLFFSLTTFGNEFACNGSIHGILKAALGGIPGATYICKILLILLLFLGFYFFHPDINYRFRHDPVSGCFYVLGAVLLLSPTVHFWYLSWIVPFIVLRPSTSWIVLCLTISSYFVSNGIALNTGEWRLPLWSQIIEWAPFYILFIFEISIFVRRIHLPVCRSVPQSVSVVIPTRNEAKNIGACIDAIIKDHSVVEVIVVDSASNDQTVMLAESLGAKVIKHSVSPENGGGRGGQIYAGIRAARGDIIAIVHADTIVTRPTFTDMLILFAKNPMIAGGAVGGIFNDADWRMRLIEFLNDFRAVFLGIGFGDQVQFFRRKPILERNLFPAIPLMEDVELSLRLNTLGRQAYLFGNALISARRWQNIGFKNSISVICRVASYLWQRIWKQPDTLAMYRNYYNQEKKLS